MKKIIYAGLLLVTTAFATASAAQADLCSFNASRNTHVCAADQFETPFKGFCESYCKKPKVGKLNRKYFNTTNDQYLVKRDDGKCFIEKMELKRTPSGNPVFSQNEEDKSCVRYYKAFNCQDSQPLLQNALSAQQGCKTLSGEPTSKGAKVCDSSRSKVVAYEQKCGPYDSRSDEKRLGFSKSPKDVKVSAAQAGASCTERDGPSCLGTTKAAIGNLNSVVSGMSAQTAPLSDNKSKENINVTDASNNNVSNKTSVLTASPEENASLTKSIRKSIEDNKGPLVIAKPVPSAADNALKERIEHYELQSKAFTKDPEPSNGAALGTTIAPAPLGGGIALPNINGKSDKDIAFDKNKEAYTEKKKYAVDAAKEKLTTDRNTLHSDPKDTLLGDVFNKNVRNERKAVREDKAQLKQAKAELAAAKELDVTRYESITTEGDAGQGNCGKYGGASCNKTNTTIQVVSATQQLGNLAGGRAVGVVGARASANVYNKGANATSNDFSNGAIDTANSAIKAEFAMIVTDVAGGAFELHRQHLHSKSIDKVGNAGKAAADRTNASNDKSEAFNQYSDNEFKKLFNPLYATLECAQQKDPGDCKKGLETKAKHDADDYAKRKVLANIRKNVEVEQNAQTAASEQAKMAFFGSMIEAKTHVDGYKSAKMAKAYANAQIDQSRNAGGFLFNPGAGGGHPGPDGISLNPIQEPGSVVDNTSTDQSAGLPPGLDQFNPSGDGGIGGAPQAAAFIPGAAGSGQGSGPLGAGGGAGSTSAAKDDGAGKDAGAGPGKGQTGGSYAAGDGPTGGYARNGGSGAAPVGMDNGFADLLKKFLPEDSKDKVALAIDPNDDRSPASEKAAVISRNKNIFTEISKRYQKKNSEGAIVF